jgi:hypothetical protein
MKMGDLWSCLKFDADGLLTFSATMLVTGSSCNRNDITRMHAPISARNF